MTEQELREKIAKHVCCACEMGLGDGDCAEGSDFKKCGVCLDVADALIADGIGDVKVLERALDLCEIAYLLALNGKQNEGISQEAIISDLGIHGFFIKKAEKELQEAQHDK